MILLTLVSRQIWPQVLAVAHLRPSQVILLHSADPHESRGPAHRLQRFFDQSGLVPHGTTRLELIPDQEFGTIERRFDEIQAGLQLPLQDCAVNFTGGNKLMATAAFRWGVRHAKAFYLERRNQLTWFTAPDGKMVERVEFIAGKTTDALDAAALLSCQFGDDVVQFPGEMLTLNPKGRAAAPQDLTAKLQGETRLDRGAFDFRKWLQIENVSHRFANEGDNLEYGAACALLKCGVPAVRRGIELSTLPRSGNTEGELDLVFNRNGRLWVVDCKDRVGGEAKLDALRTAILRAGTPDQRTESILTSIAEDLKDRDLKILREDLLQVAEVGGSLGCALAVRSSKLPQQAIEFAASRHPRVEILLKSELMMRLPAILAGRRAA